MSHRNTILVAGLTVLLVASGPAVLADATAPQRTDAVKDAWLDGKLETVYLLNRHLNNFTIDTDVVNGKAMLEGEVETEVERELATALAKGVDGIVEVQNDLVVTGEQARRAPAEAPSTQRDFMQIVNDATTTASIKSTLLMNENTHGLDIDVDTLNDVVTLSGAVESAEEKALAEQLARNAAGVDAVTNNLQVRTQ